VINKLSVGVRPPGEDRMHRIAVFARNHESYLKAACAIKDPSQLVTFQSERRWVGAWKALIKQETVRIYFAPIGSEAKIRYEATVKAIDLEPVADASLLEFRLPDTVNEGLWGKTLYALSHCRPCLERNISALQKEDGTPLSDNFAYSYALVRESDSGPTVECHPEEIPGGVKYPEGTVGQVMVNAYERNLAARQACVKHHGTSCAVCGFNFGATYGEIGAGFIHVHHLKPLASIKEGYDVDPVNDLTPVCPNCHAMLHRRTPPFSVEELAASIMAGTT
jgi:hypothetical protein